MINMYYHNGSDNHGCEAIVRSTVNIVNDNVTLYTTRANADRKYGIDEIAELREDTCKPLQRKSFEFVLFALHHKLTGSDYWYTRFSHRLFFKLISKGSIYFSIGGDNYCYGGTDILAHYNSALHHKGAKTVLWGCSA